MPSGFPGAGFPAPMPPPPGAASHPSQAPTAAAPGGYSPQQLQQMQMQRIQQAQAAQQQNFQAAQAQAVQQQQAQTQQQRLSASQQQMQQFQMQFMAHQQAAAAQQAQVARLGTPSPKATAAAHAAAAAAAAQQALSRGTSSPPGRRRPSSASPAALGGQQSTPSASADGDDGGKPTAQAIPSTDAASASGGPSQPVLQAETTLSSATSLPKTSRSSLERSAIGTGTGGIQPSPPPTSSSSAGNNAATKGGGGTTSDHATATALSPEEVRSLLSKCTWEERVIFAARQLLGGHAVNGFLRGTAAAQRMKKQRGRQAATAQAKRVEKAEAAAAAAVGTEGAAAAAAAAEEAKKKKAYKTDQEAEEGLKEDTLNAKTAKRIKAELQAAQGFCDFLAVTVQSILSDMGGEDVDAQSEDAVGSMEWNIEQQAASAQNPAADTQQLGAMPMGTSSGASLSGLRKKELMEKMHKQSSSSGGLVAEEDRASERPDQDQQQQQQQLSKPTQGPGTDHNPHAETVAAGNPNGSTLRRNRKRPPGHPVPNEMAGLSEEDKTLLNAFDDSGRRRLTKKEVSYRSFEITRFRTLRVGDYVAARVASHELWILARVVREWKALDVSHSELMSMTETKRGALFKEKVYIQDIEEYNGDIRHAKAVARQLVLPLPRTYEEAASWCTRCKKGTRVYAMYPKTTSLYCATSVDNTTYCRGEDDVVVVEFDGDEDDTNNVPQRHIPARFVTLIPREFPAAQVNRKKRRSSSAPLAGQPPTSAKPHGHGQSQQESSLPLVSSRKGSVSAPATTSKGDRNGDPASASGGMDVRGGELDDMISDMAKGNFDASVDLENFGSFDFEDDFLGDPSPVTKKKSTKTATSFAAVSAASGTKAKQSKKSGSKQSKKAGDDAATSSGSTKKSKGSGGSTKGRRSSSKKSSDGGKKRTSDTACSDKVTSKKSKK